MSVDGNHRNVVLIALQQILIAFDVDLFKRIFVVVAGGHDYRFCLFAKMATGPTVDYDFRFT